MTTTFPKQTWTDKVGASVKNGTDKLATLAKPNKSQPAESSELQPDKRPGPAVYVALAEMQERAGNISGAETQLRKALELDPNNLGALLAYAHLEDRQRNFQAALRYYNRALKKHGKDAAVHNDMGLCFHRHNKLEEAEKSLQKAVDLEPDSKLYRANLAAVMVDRGNTNAALDHLVAAHGRPVGHYNLGYLLMQKRDTNGALHHFRQAAQIDPTFPEAHQWVAHLSAPPAGMQHAGGGQSPVMMARRDARATEHPSTPAPAQAGYQSPPGVPPQTQYR